MRGEGRGIEETLGQIREEGRKGRKKEGKGKLGYEDMNGRVERKKKKEGWGKVRKGRREGE